MVGVVGALVALVTLVKALVEYRQQGRQKRAEHFFDLRSRLKGSREFAPVAELIDNAHMADAARRKLQEVPFHIKRDYLGLFEEIAIAMNSGLIKPQVAHYMFGYYALLCRDSNEFWFDVNRLSDYWSLFNDFCDQMEIERERFVFRRDDFRF
jgi:hypothetical protein